MNVNPKAHMQHWEYFLLLGGCLISSTSAAWLMNVLPIFKTCWKSLFFVLSAVFLLFSIWDYFAIQRGHWYFNPSYITGHFIIGIPIEELAFFLLIPLFCLFTWEIIKKLV